jgi:hypothetical protein
MSVHNFTMKCDTCGMKTEMYGYMPRCRECGETCCEDCMVPRSHDEEKGGCLCLKCKKEAGAPEMGNQFLEAPIQFLKASIESGMTGKTAFETVLRMLQEIPTQAAYCPCCSDQFDAKNGEVAPPTVVRKRSCGHSCCDRCYRHCHDGNCSNDGCADCMTACEGHAEAFCKYHIIGKTYCRGCAPRSVLREADRPAHVYEA